MEKTDGANFSVWRSPPETRTEWARRGGGVPVVVVLSPSVPRRHQLLDANRPESTRRILYWPSSVGCFALHFERFFLSVLRKQVDKIWWYGTMLRMVMSLGCEFVREKLVIEMSYYLKTLPFVSDNFPSVCLSGGRSVGCFVCPVMVS